MSAKVSARDRYLISISEYCSTKDIQKLLDVSLGFARDIKHQVLLRCISENIKLYSSTRVPTDVVLSVTGKSTQYFFDKMVAESEALKYVCAPV